MQITVAGRNITFPGNVDMSTAFLDHAELMINGMLSRPNVEFVYYNEKNLLANTNGTIQIFSHKTLQNPTRDH